MKTFLGTKLVNAMPMTRDAYNELRKWQLPADENGDDEGYLVEYTDGGAPNTDLFIGYVSWSPKEQFEGAYRETTGLNFGLAVEALKDGQKVRRAGWNGKGMFLSYVAAEQWATDKPEAALIKLPWIGIKTADDCFVPWLASQTDILADDWELA